jgi:hypothetical protein
MRSANAEPLHAHALAEVPRNFESNKKSKRISMAHMFKKYSWASVAFDKLNFMLFSARTSHCYLLTVLHLQPLTPKYPKADCASPVQKQPAQAALQPDPRTRAVRIEAELACLLCLRSRVS